LQLGGTAEGSSWVIIRPGERARLARSPSTPTTYGRGAFHSHPETLGRVTIDAVDPCGRPVRVVVGTLTLEPCMAGLRTQDELPRPPTR